MECFLGPTIFGSTSQAIAVEKQRIRKKVNKILVLPMMCYTVLYCVRLRETVLYYTLLYLVIYTGRYKIKRWLVIGSHFVHRYMYVPYRDNNI